MADQNFGTVLGPDANFKGELSFDSNAQILGKFEGSITAKGKLHVADGSNCKAAIHASDVTVEGAVEGNVEAGKRLELTPTGSIKGDIVADTMAMADGAAIDGYCKIGVKGGGSGGGSSSKSKSSSTTETKPAPQAATAKS